MKKNLNDEGGYQLSITEVAFILVILLVLLLGFKLNDSLNQIEEAEEKISKLDNIVNSYLGPSVLDPNSVDDLMPCNKCVSYVKKVPMSEAEKYILIGKNIVKNLENVDDKDVFPLYQKLIDASLALSEGKDLSIKKTRKDNVELNEQYLSLGKNLYSIFKKENLDENSIFLLNQKLAEVTEKLAKGVEITYSDEDLSSKLNTLANKIQQCNLQEIKLKSDNAELIKKNKYLIKRAGLDDPPCWVGDDNKAKYIFHVTVLGNANEIIFKEAWPADREAEALAMKPVQALIEYKNRAMPKDLFLKYAKEIYEIGNKNPLGKCRYFIIYDGTSIKDAKISNKTRIEFNNLFYHYEVQN